MSRTVVGVLFVAVAGLSGCASPARVIDHEANRVVVAVPDNTNAWPFYYEDAAKEAAAAHIADPVLTSSHRVKVGEQTTTATDTTRKELGKERSFGDIVTSTSTTATADRYEYHLEFRSGSPVRGSHTWNEPNMPPIPGAPAASLSPRGPAGNLDGLKPAVIPPIEPIRAPSSPATNLPTTTLPGPGH
jgi:hypothetical protein